MKLSYAFHISPPLDTHMICHIVTILELYAFAYAQKYEYHMAIILETHMTIHMTIHM
jgi:hypothetical protein